MKSVQKAHHRSAAPPAKGITMRYSEHLCLNYQQAIELLGKRWTGLIIMVLLQGPLRFNEIAEQIATVSDRMLSERLKELETEGVIERHVYPETPVRIEYRLSEKGRALQPVVAAIGEWSHRWIEVAPATVE
jgi:DNA-binding HxlR family transcriptional regulator